jgi:hypothetical protein
METLEPHRRPPWGRFLTLLLSLGVMAGILGSLLAILLPQARHVGGPQRAWMVRLSLVCVALLGLTLVAMFWHVVRFLGSRFQKPLEHDRTQHVDAWSLAGKRMQVSQEEDQEPEK